MTVAGGAYRLAIGDWIFDPSTQRLSGKGRERILKPKEVTVLLQLADAAPAMVGRQALLDQSWPDVYVGDHALHEVVGRLRRALDDDARDPTYIETLSRRGYRLIAPVRALVEPPPIGNRVNTNRSSGVWWTSMAALATGCLIWWLTAWHEPTTSPKAPAPLSTARFEHLRLAVAMPDPVGGTQAEFPLRKIGADLVEALAQSTPFETVPLFGTDASAPPGRSAMRHDGRSMDYLLRGTVSGDGEFGLLTLELVSGDRMSVLWVEHFALKEQRYFDKSPYVANIVRETVLMDRIQHDLPFTSDDARALFVRALVLFGNQDLKGGPTDFRVIVRLLKQAVALDPEVPGPHAFLALAYANSKWGSDYRTVEDVMARSKRANAAARRAIELDGELPLPYLALAVVKYLLDRDFPQALNLIEQAHRRGYPTGVIEYHLGMTNLLQGRFEEAITHYEAALAAGGATQDTGMSLRYLAMSLIYLGRHHDGLQVLERLQRTVRGDSVAQPWLWIMALVALGDLDRAHALLNRVLEQQPPPALHVLPGVLAQVGRRDEARAILDELEDRFVAGQRFPCVEAFVGSFYVGDRALTLKWLTRAIEQREVFPRFHSAEFAELWQEPDFHNVRQRIGQPMFGDIASAAGSHGARPPEEPFRLSK